MIEITDILSSNLGNFEFTIRDNCLVSLMPSNKTICMRHKFALDVTRDIWMIKQILNILNGCNSKITKKINLNPTGSYFQKDVWQAVLEIPQGQASTYGEIARKIGNPKAVRAVGTAVGKNPIAILIPCHRVLPASGKLGNYRWGEEMKKKLLEAEGIKF